MRVVWPISVSERNPDALVVARALQGTPKGDRSALLLHWAAAYLSGQTSDQAPIIPDIGMTDEEVSALLDDF